MDRLQELCGGDNELYHALSNLMFLDPRKITLSLESILAEAREHESKGNKLRAEVSYRIAGGISLYKGDVEGLRTYFTRAAMLAENSHPEYGSVAKRAEEAVNIARKYYETTP